jgi:nitrate/nitrite transport system ATP-binding protein
VLDVKLPRPRRRLELADDPGYMHCRAQVLKFLHEYDTAALKEAV